MQAGTLPISNGMKNVRKHDRMMSLIGRLAAEFFLREGGKQSLIKVTNTLVSDDMKYATIFFTTLPSDKEQEALLLARRRAGDVRKFIEEHARMGHVPFLHFAIDLGEKNRQRIEELSKNKGGL